MTPDEDTTGRYATQKDQRCLPSLLVALMLSLLKPLANTRDVPYQSLLTVYLADRVTRETRGGRRPVSKRSVVGTRRGTARD